MCRLLIARHGNTFDKGDTILRVGLGTDIPLSNSGTLQAKQLGTYLQQVESDIDTVFTSELKRTIQTADIALDAAGFEPFTQPLTIFNEIDYGPDEGKPEVEVVERIGEVALSLWDQEAIPPEGWMVDIDQIKLSWRRFAIAILEEYPDQTVMVVTSNGIARFAPYVLLKNPETFALNHSIKLSTGAIGCFQFENNEWTAEYWNRKPKNYLEQQTPTVIS